MQVQVTEILARTLIDDAKDDPERDVVDQATADESRRAVGGTRILRVIHGRDARATVLLIMKPDQTVILQVVIDSQNRDQRDRLWWQWRHQKDTVDPDRR